MGKSDRSFLDEVIELAQDIAPEQQLPSLSHKRVLDSEARAVLQSLPSQVKKRLQDWRFRDDDEVLQTYEFIRFVRELLSTVAALDESASAGLKPPAVDLYTVTVYGDGGVSLFPTPFYWAIEELRKREFEGIRECRFCGRLFFAKRKDKLYCQDSCRTKNWNRNNPERRLDIQVKSDLKRSKKDE